MEPYKYIAQITKEELEKNTVIPCLSDDGFQSILIKNVKEKTVSSQYATDNLNIKLDTTLLCDGVNYYFHIIQSKKNDFYSTKQFDVIYQYIFKKILEPINSIDLFNLISSLEEYFRMTPDPNRKNLQIGVFGELLFVRYLYQSGYPEITEKYHNNFYSKHDVEISSTLRVEIKTASGEKRIHHFKHNQIHRSDVDVYIGSLLLEESKEGLSLYQLFKQVISFYTSPDSIFALEKLMIRCGVSDEEEGPSFSEEKAVSSIRIYNAKSLPQLNVEEENGVTNIEYDVDCSLATATSLDEVLSVFKSAK